MKLLFWISLVLIVYTYIGYPVIISILAMFQKKKKWLTVSEYPSVSVIISAYNEEASIADKIRECMALDYPKDRLEIIVGSDHSTDKTNDILRAVEKTGVRTYFGSERRGKPHVLNNLVAMAKGEILLFTDARQPIEKSALKKLIRHFQDKEVGCVSGELVFLKQDGITGAGVGAYWKYEKFLREKESLVYSMIGATGAIYAVRKELFEPIPENIILDDVYTPLVCVKKGYRTVFERDAIAYDRIAETPHDEFRRKTRTLGGNYQIFFTMPEVMDPFKSRLAFQIISHKIFRVLVPFFMVTLFISNLIVLDAEFYQWILALQVMFYLMAWAGAAFRRNITGALGIPYLFCLMNLSAVVGFMNFATGKIEVRWKK